MILKISHAKLVKEKKRYSEFRCGIATMFYLWWKCKVFVSQSFSFVFSAASLERFGDLIADIETERKRMVSWVFALFLAKFLLFFRLASSGVLSVCTTRLCITHWGRVMHICISKLTIIGSDNGLSPGRRQAIISTNAGILFIEPLGTNFNEILIEIHIFSFKKIHLKMSSGKCRPCCCGLNVLTHCGLSAPYGIIDFGLYWCR